MIFKLIKAFAHFLNRFRFSFRPLFFIFLAAILLFMDCSERRNRFKPTDYFPIKSGHTWVFNGAIHKMEITNITKGAGDKVVTFSYSDKLGVLLWQEKVNFIKGQLFMQSYEPKTNLLPTLSFDPALPFAPISRKIGLKDKVECIETQVLNDTLITTNDITVYYLIEAIEDVRVPAGNFINCIKMKINVIYPQDSKQPFFIGDRYWWFAPRVGPVKYDLPTASGELIEMPDIKMWQSDLSRD